MYFIFAFFNKKEVKNPNHLLIIFITIIIIIVYHLQNVSMCRHSDLVRHIGNVYSWKCTEIPKEFFSPLHTR